MYQTVIVPFDGSRLAETALGSAVRLADHCGAEILVLSVAGDRGEKAARQADVRRRVDQITAVPATSLVTFGDEPGAAIARVVSGQERPIVCMSTHGRGGLARALLGSVAEDLLRRISDPVLLVGPHTSPDASPVDGQLMVCLDGSGHAEAILPTAAAWAREFTMELYLVQVLHPDSELLLRAAGIPAGDVYEDAYLARVASRLRGEGVPVNWDVLLGTNPVAAILDHAGHHGASLMALSTHGRTGLRRIAIGSVALRVVHDSRCAALVLRPKRLASE